MFLSLFTQHNSIDSFLLSDRSEKNTHQRMLASGLRPSFPDGLRLSLHKNLFDSFHPSLNKLKAPQTHAPELV